MADTPIRDAATVILLREVAGARQVLMGQRGAKAAFMPSKFVFPGGALDAGDADVPLLHGSPCAARLREDSPQDLSHALAVAAIRELWEETGLALGRPGEWSDAPADWQAFAARGLVPDASALRFVFRAITPPGRPRRFDARFFLAPVSAVAGDADDFSAASDELSHLQWVPLDEARSLDLPFITEVVLAEIAAADPAATPVSVPFFRNDDEESLFLRLRGEDQQDHG
ncbi:MAG: NUDIX domain-containing protein [Pseudomonadota bacterium]